MNYKDIVILSGIFTITIAFIMNINELLHMMIIFLLSFIFCCIWNYPISKPIIPQITKDIDEMIHPVIDTVKVLHLTYLEKHYGKQYNKNFVEKCSCGSTIFRVYNEETENGLYVQHICALCNIKATGIELYNKEEKIDNK